MDGNSEGSNDGYFVGDIDGVIVGRCVGDTVGRSDGFKEGIAVVEVQGPSGTHAQLHKASV